MNNRTMRRLRIRPCWANLERRDDESGVTPGSVQEGQGSDVG